MNRKLSLFGLTAALGAIVVVPEISCSKDATPVVARRITSRADLIGGPGALGDVGDFLLANDKIRVIIQAGNYSRGFGVYGGALIDADLQRPQAAGDSAGGNGFDNFSELFPALFLKAMRPFPGERGFSVKELEDGSATITVTGTAADFLAMVKNVNELVAVSEGLQFFNEYKLTPGKNYVEITTSIINGGVTPISFPDPGIKATIGSSDFAVPTGDVILFGAGNSVFAPGAGFDLRFTLEDVYRDPPALPAFPGLVAPFIATKGHRISYGFTSGIQDEETSFVKRAGYPGARTDDLLVPFIFSAFTGAFFGAAPERLKPGEEFSFKKYFIVGGGDVSEIRDTVHSLRGYTTGTFSGLVREVKTNMVEAGADVLTFDAAGKPYSQHTTDATGQFRGAYELGKYTYRVLVEGRFPTEPRPFEVVAGKVTSVQIGVASPGFVGISVVGEDGRALPAKCSLVGRHGRVAPNSDPADFLFDRRLGERFRPSDFITDSDKPETREFLEKVIHAPRGTATAKVRPGKYRAVCSRGIEYDISESQIEVREGQLAQVTAMLRHTVDTRGWASGDYHLHQLNSVDSEMPLADRVIESASEGIDIACATDHNFVTDLGPSIASNGLEGWLQGMVGLEMTTLESGHFNGFPLTYDPGPITKGAFRWAERTPKELLTDLRKLGRYGPERTIVQVNHPRDTILGYFNQYNFNPDKGDVEASRDTVLALDGRAFGHDKFDYDFDALEIFNGKRYELLHSYRVPEQLPAGPLPENIPPAGSILREASGDVAFPGGLEDWFTLLNQGRRYTATGNSDSHHSGEEPGSPRTYTPVSNDRPGEIDELEIVRAMKAQKAMVTNGPFILVDVDGVGMGETADGTDGSATMRLTIRSAPWIEFNTVNIYRNGEVVDTITGDRESLASIERSIAITRDAWVLAEVIGTKSQWPVVVPHEVPSLQISDAVGGIAGTFGLDLNPFGNLRPVETSVTYSYAFTNPVYVDSDGDGQFNGPGVSRQALTAAETAPRLSVRKPSYSELPAVVKLFSAFAHGH